MNENFQNLTNLAKSENLPVIPLVSGKFEAILYGEEYTRVAGKIGNSFISEYAWWDNGDAKNVVIRCDIEDFQRNLEIYGKEKGEIERIISGFHWQKAIFVYIDP